MNDRIVHLVLRPGQPAVILTDSIWGKTDAERFRAARHVVQPMKLSEALKKRDAVSIEINQSGDAA